MRRRVYSIACLRGSTTLQNFGLLYTTDYVLTRNYIRRRNPPGVGRFFIIGTTTVSQLVTGEEKKNRQLCIRPMWELFRRGVAFAGKVLGEKALFIPTFTDGVSFSSRFYRGR